MLVLVDVVCVGSAVLAWAGHYVNTPFLTTVNAIVVASFILAVIPAPPASTRQTVASVVAASDPPPAGLYGPCTMTLRVMRPDGSEVEVAHVDPRTPTSDWPRAGGDLIVNATRGRRPRVSVDWFHGVTYPEPAADQIATQTVASASLQTDHGLPLVAFPPASIDFTVQEPGVRVRVHLFPTEQFRGEWRRHPVRWIKEVTAGLGLAVALQYGLALLPEPTYRFEGQPADVDLADLPLVEFAAQAFWLVWALWRGQAWLTNRLALTNKRVMWITGILSLRVVSLPLGETGRTVLTRSFLGFLFGHGTLRFSSVPPLRPLWRVGDLPNVAELYWTILEETFEPEISEARRLPLRIVEDDDLGGLASPSEIDGL